MPPRDGPKVGQERKDQRGMEERRCAGRWGTPMALQLHGLLLLWMASMIFSLYQFVIASLSVVWEHRPSHYSH